MAEHQREKDRHRERDRDADKSRDRERDAEKEKNRERERERDADKLKERERERERDVERDKSRNRDRDADKDKGREKDREADRERAKDRERERKRPRSRSNSPHNDRGRRSASPVDHHGDRGRRVLSRREGREHEKRVDHENESSSKKHASEAREDGPNQADRVHEKQQKNTPQGQAVSSASVVQGNEEDLMKKFGIPTGFTTTKGKFVPDANHSAVKLTSKRLPRQYMNRRGGFNRPLPAETNR